MKGLKLVQRKEARRKLEIDNLFCTRFGYHWECNLQFWFSLMLLFIVLRILCTYCVCMIILHVISANLCMHKNHRYTYSTNFLPEREYIIRIKKEEHKFVNACVYLKFLVVQLAHVLENWLLYYISVSIIKSLLELSLDSLRINLRIKCW